jgi:hypothetical protein
MQGGEPLSVRSSAKRVKRSTGTILGFSLPRRPLFPAERSAAIFAIFANVGAAHPRLSEFFSRQLFSRDVFLERRGIATLCRRISRF